ncbi:MAG: PqqD family protein [Oscillospiraceae bacterium]|nr:PqqD family protein [Oscillospiraceae bacterium]
MKIKKELVTREIGGDTILVPVGKTVLDANGLFALNELGAFIWERLPQAASAEDITRAILEEYEVSEADAARDVAEFLHRLQEMDII